MCLTTCRAPMYSFMGTCTCPPSQCLLHQQAGTAFLRPPSALRCTRALRRINRVRDTGCAVAAFTILVQTDVVTCSPFRTYTAPCRVPFTWPSAILPDLAADLPAAETSFCAAAPPFSPLTAFPHTAAPFTHTAYTTTTTCSTTRIWAALPFASSLQGFSLSALRRTGAGRRVSPVLRVFLRYH